MKPLRSTTGNKQLQLCERKRMNIWANLTPMTFKYNEIVPDLQEGTTLEAATNRLRGEFIFSSKLWITNIQMTVSLLFKSVDAIEKFGKRLQPVL